MCAINLKHITLISFALIILLSCKSFVKHSDIYLEAKYLIKNSSSVKNHALDYFNTDKVNIMVTNVKIPISLISLETDIIEKDYMADYGELRKLNQIETELIDKVYDSLKKKETILNSNFIKQSYDPFKELKIGSDYNFILSFSDNIDNNIYALLIPYDPTVQNAQYGTLLYGPAFSFLFHVNNKGKIIKTYSTQINLN